MSRLVPLFLLRHEHGRQADQRHVAIPAFPHPHLVLNHPQFILRFVKGMFDPVTLILDVGESLQIRFRREVCQTVFEIAIPVFSNDESSLAREAVGLFGSSGDLKGGFRSHRHPEAVRAGAWHNLWRRITECCWVSINPGKWLT